MELNLDLDSVPPTGRSFSNLDHALLQVLRDGRKRKCDIVNSVRRWRAYHGEPDIKVQMAEAFSEGYSNGRYFDREIGGRVLSEKGKVRALTALTRAGAALAKARGRDPNAFTPAALLVIDAMREKPEHDPVASIVYVAPPADDPLAYTKVRTSSETQLVRVNLRSGEIIEDLFLVTFEPKFDAADLERFALHPQTMSPCVLQGLAESAYGKRKFRLLSRTASRTRTAFDPEVLAKSLRRQTIDVLAHDPLLDPRLP